MTGSGSRCPRSRCTASPTARSPSAGLSLIGLVSGSSWELYLHRFQRVDYQQRGLRTTAGGTERAIRANLRAALGFLQLPPRAPELQLLHRWLDTWAGVG